MSTAASLWVSQQDLLTCTLDRDLPVWMMHGLFQYSDTFPTPPSIYPTRPGICSAGSQQLLTKAVMYGNAAVYCPVLMGAGLDRDSPIHFQLPTHFIAL